MQIKKKHNLLWFKIGLYLFLLYVVFSAMQYSRSTTFTEKLVLFFGPSPLVDKSLTLKQNQSWCVEKPIIIAYLEKDIFITDRESIEWLCNIIGESYQKSELEGLKWTIKLESRNSQGQVHQINVDSTLSYIKTKELIYKTSKFKHDFEKVFGQK
ncbi:MAG: hypothetical protein L6Q33_14740 [Bacteriovoracaceae bacterium]|nr:hypothetical protein [Bacteriovoracaceae bacterium]NUM57504.1 hypothetical protein [Pseudobdellovibrionaceae bacterium]